METTKQTPHLQHLVEFERLLVNYRPSSSSIQTLRNESLLLIAGPTAAGKNTLISLLNETGRYHSLVSDTTRPPRSNDGVMEQNGREYWFKTEKEFLVGLKSGQYIEAAVIHRQQVSGMNIARIEEAAKSGKIAINEIEIQGVANVHRYKPDTLCIFLLPPTFDIWMERLRGRGEMADLEVRRRLEIARQEIHAALKVNYYQFVINNEIHEAAQAVDELANGRAVDQEKQALGRNHAEQLAIDVQLYLAS